MSEEEVKEFAAKLQCGYHLVSCRTGAGVDEAFADVLSQNLDLHGVTAEASPVQTEVLPPTDGGRRPAVPGDVKTRSQCLKPC